MQNYQVRRILIPVDFSDTSLIALDHAIHLAKISRAEITLLHMIERLLTNTNSAEFYAAAGQEHIAYEKEVINKGKAHIEAIAGEIRKKHKIKITASTVFGRTHAGIIGAAESLKADLIIMGTHGVSGFREFVMGSNTFRVVSEAKCPVLSVQEHTKTPGFQKILMPFRIKAHSREKVDYAMSIAKLYGSSIHVLGVDEEGDDFKHIKPEAAQIMGFLEKEGIPADLELRSGQYLGNMLLDEAKKVNADLIIIMSDMDKVHASEYVLGPVAQQVVNHSKIPVFSIKPRFNPNTIDFHGYGW